MPLDYQIAIPSYRRHEVCRARTIATLLRLKADPGRMTVYVADDTDFDAYSKELKGLGVTVAKGVPGLLNQRRHYNLQYPRQTRLINVDDDLYDLKAVTKSGDLVSYDGTLDEIAEHGFSTCESHGARLWGIAAFENGFYMKRSTSTGLRYICGIFHGSYAGDSVMCGPDRPLASSGEDFETTLRSFKKYGVVVRLDWLCPKTKYFAEGGMREELGGSNELRQVEHTRELKHIAARHHGLASCYKKSGGVVNLRLKTLPVTRVPVPESLLP
jgi:hypothetical protein